MNKRVSAALLLALCTSTAWADSIDDAEAKKRGIPVSQLQVEKELAKAKARNAELEKQVAELQKKLAEAQGVKSGAAAAPSALITEGPAAAASPPTMTAESTLSFDGPRQSSPLYDDFVKRYLDGEWATLAADMSGKQKEIAALPAGNVADLTYIRQVLAESRPAWWDGVRTGKVTLFKPRVWKREFNASFKNDLNMGILSAPLVNGATVPMYSWPTEAMEDMTPIENMNPFYLSPRGDHGFTKRDVMTFNIWSFIGSSSLLVEVGDVKRKALPPDQARQYLWHQVLRQDTTAGYYGTPKARRAACVRALSSLHPDMNGNAQWAGVRPLGAAILMEVASHQEQYKSIPMELRMLDPNIPMANIPSGASMQEQLVGAFMGQTFLESRLTLDEDRRIRDLIRSVAEKNLDWKTDVATLPENLKWHFDMSQDATFAAARKAFLVRFGKSK